MLQKKNNTRSIEKRENKYLNIAFVDNNDDVLKIYMDVFRGIKSGSEKIT